MACFDGVYTNEVLKFVYEHVLLCPPVLQAKASCTTVLTQGKRRFYPYPTALTGVCATTFCQTSIVNLTELSQTASTTNLCTHQP